MYDPYLFSNIPQRYCRLGHLSLVGWYPSQFPKCSPRRHDHPLALAQYRLFSVIWGRDSMMKLHTLIRQVDASLRSPQQK